MKNILISIAIIILTALNSYGAEDVDISSNKTNSTEQKTQNLVMGGVKFDSITGPTASACYLLQINHPDRFLCSHDFWIFQTEVGRGGGKLQCGIGTWYMTGGGAKLSLLRTWGDPMGVNAYQTYLGAELQLNIFLINGTAGIYSRIAGDDDKILFSWSTGIGF